FAEAGGDEPLSRLIRTWVTIHGLARCNSSDLAGISVSLLPRARTGCACTDRKAPARGNGAHYRRDPPARYSAAAWTGDDRLQLDLRDRPRRRDPFDLRQGPSRAIRRVSAVSGLARAARSDAAHKSTGRVHRRRPSPQPGSAWGPEFLAAGLLRD